MSQNYRKQKAIARALESQSTLNMNSSNQSIRTLGLSLAVWIACFMIYVLCLAPSMLGGDSGELIAMSYREGVIHPPGYPLYAILAKLLSWIPIRDIPWRINLLSAFCDSIATSLLCFSVIFWSGSLWAGLVSAAVFAFSDLVWTYAVSAEVFPLNNVFVAGMLLFTVIYAKKNGALLTPQSESGFHPKLKFIVLGTFFIGLGLTNHHALALYGCVVAIWIFIKEFKNRRFLFSPLSICILFFSFLIGLSPYLYLPYIASSHLSQMGQSGIGWGQVSTLTGFIRHLTRADFGSFQLVKEAQPSSNPEGSVFFIFLKRCSYEFYGLVMLLGIFGAVMSLISLWRFSQETVDITPKWKQSLTILWIAAPLFYLVIFCSLVNVDLNGPRYVMALGRFWQQPYLILCAWAGNGVALLLSSLTGHSKIRTLGIVSIISGIMIVIIQLFPSHNQSQNWLFHDFGKAILESLPQKSILLVQGDSACGALSVLQKVEGVRPDVKVLNQGLLSRSWSKVWTQENFPDITFPLNGIYAESEGYTMKDLLDANLAKFSIFIWNGFEPWDQSYRSAYMLWPVGFIEMALPIDPTTHQALLSTFGVENWLRTGQKMVEKYHPEHLEMFSPDQWEYEIQDQFSISRYNFGMNAILYAISHQDQPALLRYGISVLEENVKLYSFANPIIYRSLGLGYKHLIANDPKAIEGAIRNWKLYLEKGSPSDPLIPKIREEISSFMLKN